MNTVLIDNTDLEVWEGWVGETNSLAATWHRTDKAPRCGIQLFCTWQGRYTLMLLSENQWTTPIENEQNQGKVRQALMKYMSSEIRAINESNRLSEKVENSFEQAQTHINLWLNDQAKAAKWYQEFK